MPHDPYKYFRVEARELLDQLGKGALDLEKETPAPDLVARLLRLAHTLKGAARVVKQPEIAEHSHSVEDALAAYRETKGQVPHDRIDAVLKLLDEIGGRVASLSEPADADGSSPPRLQMEEPARTLHADVAELDELLDGLAETHAQLGTLRRALGTLDRPRHLVDLLVDHLAAPRAGGTRPQAGAADGKALSLAEELRGAFTVVDRSLASRMAHVDRELRLARNAAERVRLVPASALFTALERTARDIAQAQGKRVRFEGRGGHVHLDAHVLGAVQGALTQAVRNAVAHGIEGEAERKAAGKPAGGRVVLEVARRGRHVAFACSDDGHGVDIDAVRNALERKGLLSSETSAFGPEELIRLLLEGGVSTSRTVTEVSGRGIGLDVVRETAERLGGKVVVRTEAGRGTTIEIVVPLSITSVEAMVVEASGIAATIPLDAVRRSIRLSATDLARTPQGDTVLFEGTVLPFLPLSRALAPGTASERTVRPWSAIIVAGTDGSAAVGIDRLLGTATVVIRPLPDLAPAEALVTGVSLDQEGNPQLVLDPDGLVAEARRAAVIEQKAQTRRLPILVVDDSLTTRMMEQSILESAGYEVGVATCGEEALEKARHTDYALFLVDVEMPGIDGFTLIERLRSDPALRDTPAILVTSRNSPDDRKRGQDVGARAYIVKSEFDQGELLERIRELVR